jgi:hypothetical protein
MIALFQLLVLMTARADGDWQPGFSIPNLNLSAYGHLLVSERHGAIIRSGFAANEIILQDYHTGETNRVLPMPSGIFKLALSPNHQWLYVAFFHPTGPVGGVDTNLMEINLVAPGETRMFTTPDRMMDLIATDDRLLVLNVEGTSVSSPYRLRVMETISGRLGPYTPVSSFILAPSFEQDSVFAEGFVASTMSDTFRHRFDRTTLGWAGRRRFPVIRGEEGAPNGFPFAYTPDLRMLFTPFGIYTNLPGDADKDLRRRAPLNLNVPRAAVFDPRAPKHCLVPGHNGIVLLRTDRWESIRTYTPAISGNLGALGYGRDGDDIVAVYVESTDPDGKVLLFRPPWEMFATNQAPTARLSFSTATLTTAEPLLLDAGASTDDMTGPSRLRYRWDLDGDGQFEIPFTNSPVLVHRFEKEGPLRVQVEVEDELGERAQTSISTDLAFAPMPAKPLPQATPWQFDFGVVAAVFDLPRNRLFAVDAGGHRIIAIATDSGQATREFFVDSAVLPTVLALSPDGRHLYCVEVHRRPLLPTDYGNSYVVQFDLEAGVRAREIPVGAYTPGLAVLSDQYLASLTGPRLEIRRWPDVAPTVWTSVGTLPTALLAARADGTLYWSQNFDSTLSLRRAKFSPESSTISTPVVASMIAFQPFVFDEGRSVIMNTGQVRSLTPEAPTDFAVVTNLVVAPFRHVVDLPRRQLVGLRGEGHWEFVRTSDWSRLVIQSAPSGSIYTFGAADSQYLYEIRHPDARGLTTLDRRRLPATDLVHNEAPVLSWETLPNLIQVGSNLVVTSFAFDEDGVVAERELLVNGVPLPALPDSFPGVPGRRQWRWTPTVFGTYRLQLTAKDNLGAESRLPEYIIRVNQPPTVDFTPPFTEAPDSPVSFELPVLALDVDDRIVSVQAAYTSSNGKVRSFGVQTVPPFLFKVDQLVGRGGVLSVTAVDETGARSSKSVNLLLNAPPGDNFAKPLTLVGSEAMTGYAARQMHSDNISLAGPPDPDIGTGFGGVWWRWTAPADLAVQIDTLGSSFDTLLRVVNTNRFAVIVSENADDPLMVPASRVKFTAFAGEVFLIGVLGQQSWELGDIRLNLRSTPWLRPVPTSPPTNDLFSARANLETGVPTSGTTWGARREPQETLLGSRQTNTVWYQWTAPDSGVARIDLASTNIDPRLTVYLQGTSISRLRLVDAKDDNSLTDNTVTMFVPVTAGSNYVLRVNGAGPSEGEFTLLVRSPVVPPGGTNAPHDRLASARMLAGDLIDFDGTSRSATADPAIQSALNLTEPVNGVWWSWTPARDGHVYWSLLSLTGISESLLIQRVVTLDDEGVPRRIVPTFTSNGGPVLRWPTVAGTKYYLFAGVPAARSPADFRFFLNNLMLPAALRLQPPELTTDGAVRLGMHSPFERRATIEASSNLQDWRVLRNVTLLPGTSLLDLPQDASALPTFFRLRSDD